MYVWIFEHWRFWTLPLRSWWAWALAFLAADLAYYVLHRANHGKCTEQQQWTRFPVEIIFLFSLESQKSAFCGQATKLIIVQRYEPFNFFFSFLIFCTMFVSCPVGVQFEHGLATESRRWHLRVDCLPSHGVHRLHPGGARRPRSAQHIVRQPHSMRLCILFPIICHTPSPPTTQCCLFLIVDISFGFTRPW